MWVTKFLDASIQQWLQSEVKSDLRNQWIVPSFVPHLWFYLRIFLLKTIIFRHDFFFEKNINFSNFPKLTIVVVNNLMIVHLSRYEKCNIPWCSILFDKSFNLWNLFCIFLLIQIGRKKTTELEKSIVTLICQFSNQFQMNIYAFFENDMRPKLYSSFFLSLNSLSLE